MFSILQNLSPIFDWFANFWLSLLYGLSALNGLSRLLRCLYVCVLAEHHCWEYHSTCGDLSLCTFTFLRPGLYCWLSRLPGWKLLEILLPYSCQSVGSQAVGIGGTGAMAFHSSVDSRNENSGLPRKCFYQQSHLSNPLGKLLGSK